MSRTLIAIASLVLVLLAVVAFGGRITGGVEHWLLAFHGHHAGKAEHGTEVDENGATARSVALRDGWPDTPAGMVARRWVEAFCAGEDAMRVFLKNNYSAEDLAERPMDDRIDTYHQLYARLGGLMLGSVIESSPEELTVLLVAEDTSSRGFVFEVEEESPHRLLRISMIDHGHGHGSNPEGY